MCCRSRYNVQDTLLLLGLLRHRLLIAGPSQVSVRAVAMQRDALGDYTQWRNRAVPTVYGLFSEYSLPNKQLVLFIICFNIFPNQCRSQPSNTTHLGYTPKIISRFVKKRLTSVLLVTENIELEQ